jgi:hypothetical protein
MIRVYHSVNRDNVPEFTADRPGQALLAGAIDSIGTYPLRRMIIESVNRGGLPGVEYLPHPGYGANGSATPGFLERLSRYKVLIVTCSIFGYAIRKLFEGVAAGCTVITDLSEWPTGTRSVRGRTRKRAWGITTGGRRGCGLPGRLTRCERK